MRRMFCGMLVFLVLPASNLCRADVFGSGANSFDIEFVTVGSPGNLPDTTGDPNPAGAVPYEYRIGKYEISEQMIDKANAVGGLGLTHDGRGPNKPASSLSWFEAAKFVNWLNTSTGNPPAYKFIPVPDDSPPEEVFGRMGFQLWQPGDAGYDPANPFRSTLARYFLPSADEWYKAAFYDPVAGHYWDYPTGSDAPPLPVAFGTAPGTAVWNQPFEQGPADVYLAGGASPYGTVGQAGNVGEWEETESDLVNDMREANRGIRGGDWIPSLTTLDLSSTYRGGVIPAYYDPINVGFRVASNSIPEPATCWLVLCVAWTPLLLRRRFGHLCQQPRICSRLCVSF